MNCPHFLICYGFQSLGDVSDNNQNIKGNYTLTKYTDHTLFKNIDMDTTQFSFDFNDKLCSIFSGFNLVSSF